jgi:hypothetical protein
MAWQTPKTNWQENNALTPTDFNRIEGNIQHLQDTKETPAGAQAKVDTHAGSKQTHGISGGYYIAKTSRSDQLPAWNDIQGKPSTFTPSSHTHTPGQISPQGAGSGLNADTVDGKHLSDIIAPYQAEGYQEFSTGALDTNQYSSDFIINTGQARKAVSLFVEAGVSYSCYVQHLRPASGCLIERQSLSSERFVYQAPGTYKYTNDVLIFASGGNIWVFAQLLSNGNIRIYVQNLATSSKSYSLKVRWFAW